MFRLASVADTTLSIHADGLLLRAPRMEDFNDWAQLRQESRSFLAPWEPTWPIDDLTRQAYRRRMKRYHDEMIADLAYTIFIFEPTTHSLMGGMTLGNVRRGVSQSATLGYWMGQPFAGRGIMTKAVRIVKNFAFGRLGLRRIEAGCLPVNTASIRVLEANGFEREGYARQYLCIAGIWQDHFLYACLDDRQ
ncbi:MAG: GNAT family N-acetyltransferase [Hyphomicrobiales bacterium]